MTSRTAASSINNIPSVTLLLLPRLAVCQSLFSQHRIRQAWFLTAYNSTPPRFSEGHVTSQAFKRWTSSMSKGSFSDQMNATQQSSHNLLGIFEIVWWHFPRRAKIVWKPPNQCWKIQPGQRRRRLSSTVNFSLCSLPPPPSFSHHSAADIFRFKIRRHSLILQCQLRRRTHKFFVEGMSTPCQSPLYILIYPAHCCSAEAALWVFFSSASSCLAIKMHKVLKDGTNSK